MTFAGTIPSSMDGPIPRCSVRIPPPPSSNGTRTRRVQLCGLLLFLLFLLIKVSGCDGLIDCSDKVIDNCLRDSGSLRGNQTGIPTTKEELHNMCVLYNVGISCVEYYVEYCMPKGGSERFSRLIAGAQKTMEALCDDTPMRDEFLKHSKCHRRMGPLWSECSDMWRRRENKNVDVAEICRFRTEFLTCISNQSKSVCSPEGAQLYLKLAKDLSGPDDQCSLSSTSLAPFRPRLSMLVILSLFAIVFVVIDYC